MVLMLVLLLVVAWCYGVNVGVVIGGSMVLWC